MNHTEWIKIHDDVDSSFTSGSVMNATDDELQSWLQNLSTGYTVNETIRYREIIRGITINSVIMKRHIDRLNRRTETIQWVMIAFAFFSFIASAVNIYISVLPRPPIVIQQPIQIPEAAKSILPSQKPDQISGAINSYNHQKKEIKTVQPITSPDRQKAGAR